MRELAATPPRAAGPLAVSYTSRVQAQDAVSAAFVQAIALACVHACLRACVHACFAWEADLAVESLRALLQHRH